MRRLVPEFGEPRIQVCQLPQPLCGRMGLQFEDRVVCGAQDGYCMTVRSMNPLHIVKWRQDGTGHSRFAFTDFDTVAPKNDKTLCKGVRSGFVFGSVAELTSPARVVSTSRPPAFFWRFFLLGLKEECCLVEIPLGSGRGVVELFWISIRATGGDLMKARLTYPDRPLSPSMLCVCFASTGSGSSGGWRLLLRPATDRAVGVSLRVFLGRVSISGAGAGVAFSSPGAARVDAAPQSCCRAENALIAGWRQSAQHAQNPTCSRPLPVGVELPLPLPLVLPSSFLLLFAAIFF